MYTKNQSKRVNSFLLTPCSSLLTGRVAMAINLLLCNTTQQLHFHVIHSVRAISPFAQTENVIFQLS